MWIVVTVYVVVVAAVAVFQRRLLFFPTREAESTMLNNATMLGLEPWRDAGGAIIGWKAVTRRDAVRPANRLLVFHGNAGHAQHRDDYLHAFEDLDGGGKWEVWLFEYPGYGARGGSPSREAFRQAGRAAITQLRALDSRPLFLLGESLGGGVACDLAGDEADSVAGLILVTPFARLADVAQYHFSLLPAGLIVRDRWDNPKALAGYRGPVAVLVAGRDEVVGTKQSEALFEKLTSPKRRWFFPEATHNDSDIQHADWAGEVSAFLLGAKSPPGAGVR
jgi:pimeloyl-ACP methyl ester carboxylesterase